MPENFSGGFLKAIIGWLFIAMLMCTQSADASCKDIVNDMQLLRKAQSQIILGLADNHQMVADSINKISLDLGLYNKPAPVRVINNLNGMASAYRRRGEKAREQATALDAATAELSQKVAACLRK